MEKERSLDLEVRKLREALLELHPNYSETRISRICSAYSAYRSHFGDRLPSMTELHDYLDVIFQGKGNRIGYGEAMFLRDAVRTLFGDTAAALVTGHARSIKSQSSAPVSSDDWASVRVAIDRLPTHWQHLFINFIDLGQSNQAGALSPSTLESMADALTPWARFRGDDVRPPTGLELARFAEDLSKQGASPSRVHTVARKVYNGYTRVLSPGLRSEACLAVLRDLKAKANAAGPIRKKPCQILPASLIYETGFEIMAEANGGAHHDIGSALRYRDGLLLAIAAAVPLRRRALASLDLGTSFQPQERGVIRLDVPGRFLKVRQDQKIYERFSGYLTSLRLWDATEVWANHFRPMFDSGTCLFPSRNAPIALKGSSLQLVFGKTTEEWLGVRLNIHGIRDCVATECIETMDHGAGWARHLLGHKTEKVTMAFYDHSTGICAAREFGQLLQARRSSPTELLL